MTRQVAIGAIIGFAITVLFLAMCQDRGSPTATASVADAGEGVPLVHELRLAPQGNERRVLPGTPIPGAVPQLNPAVKRELPTVGTPFPLELIPRRDGGQ